MMACHVYIEFWPPELFISLPCIYTITACNVTQCIVIQVTLYNVKFIYIFLCDISLENSMALCSLFVVQCVLELGKHNALCTVQQYVVVVCQRSILYSMQCVEPVLSSTSWKSSLDPGIVSQLCVDEVIGCTRKCCGDNQTILKPPPIG